jgi:hypothetical protein
MTPECAGLCASGWLASYGGEDGFPSVSAMYQELAAHVTTLTAQAVAYRQELCAKILDDMAAQLLSEQTVNFTTKYHLEAAAKKIREMPARAFPPQPVHVPDESKY